VQIELLDTGDLKALNKALKAHEDGKELRKQLSKELRAAVRPMVPAIRAAWLAAPSHGHDTATRGRQGAPDLRKLLARSTRAQVRLTGKEAGVRVRTDGRKMPDRMKSLPAYAEGIKPRWRHPVFGNRDAWVTQRPFPRFYATARPDEARAREAVEAAVDKIRRQLEGAT
jgi:hypothetical protein